ncbi:MAG: S41 family peptidase [Rhodothermales bacterium]
MRLSLLLVSFCLVPLAHAQVEGYYRQPDVHGSTIIFNAEGDLWTVDTPGGAARRLTTHLGEEAWPVLSPDGQHVAFSAAYDGASDTYVMPIEGGRPKRVSWDSARPVGWTPDGKVIARTTTYAGLPDTRLIIIDTETGDVEQVPLAQAAEVSLGSDGTMFFARMPRQGSNSRWYKGGLAQKLWRYTPGADEAQPLTTDYPGTSRQPNVMADGRLYFLSDREGAMNIWSMTLTGTDLQRHTTHEDWDIQELASDGTTLVYRLGADLYTMNPATGATARVPITLVSDREQMLTDWEDAPMQRLSDAAVSKDGKRVAFVSRGELFVSPVGSGRVVHASRNSGVRYRNVVFGADSSHVFALSDRSGELEWWRASLDGLTPPTQVTDGPAMLRQDATPSPDGTWLAHTDYDGRLWLVHTEDGSTTQIATASTSGTVAWSPDSRHLVFSQSMPSLMSALHMYDTEAKTTTAITSDRFMDGNPAFSADGHWLFFISTRTWSSTVGSPWGERAPQPHFDKTAKIYALPLRPDATFPFTPPDELTPKGSRDTTKVAPRWDLAEMIREVPAPVGSYGSLMANDKRLFYRSERDLMALDLKPKAKPIRIVEGAGRIDLSGDGKHLLVSKSGKLYVIPASSGKDAKLGEEQQAMTDGLRFAVDKRAEWNQIYHDAWRLHRDYFWDPNMHGVDWEAMRDKYGALLPRVGARQELGDLQAMLVSELSLLHSSAGGGDVRREDLNVGPASLGGVFERDADTGGFRLVHRHASDPDLPGQRSPLAHPDVQMEVGSIILAVNGQSTQDAMHIGQLLMDQAGKPVRLAVQNPDGTNRDVLVTPMSRGQAFNLRYHEWEHTRRLQADAASDGTIGYVHLRAMGRGDINQWTREFFSQTNRQGLIVDVRHNNGGNIDSWVLGQLLRRAWSYFKPRRGPTFGNMQYATNAHLVVLVDERTASDGEAFADGFRRLGLGEAIGMRTWGGEVWLTSSNRQVDGGIARASELGVYGPEGKWLIEGWGFVPDHEVDNLPHATFNGQDAQLEAAITHLQALIDQDPRVMPEPPAYPVLIPGSGFPTPWHSQQR